MKVFVTGASGRRAFADRRIGAIAGFQALGRVRLVAAGARLLPVRLRQHRLPPGFPLRLLLDR